MGKTYKSDALAAIHETASDLADAGLMDKLTMRMLPSVQDSNSAGALCWELPRFIITRPQQ